MVSSGLKATGVALLVGAALLVTVQTASAQKPHREIWLNEGWNGGGGWGPWSNYRGDYGTTDYGYVPSIDGTEYYFPGYSTNQNSGQFQQFQQGQSGYFSPSDSMNNRSILVNLHVPANAEVWFDGNPTQQRGEWRAYMSPPVDSDKKMHYEVRVRWTDQNGKQIDKTRSVAVQAGRRSMVDFFRDDSSNNSNQQKSEQLNSNPKPSDLNTTKPIDTNPKPANSTTPKPVENNSNPKSADPIP